MNQTGGITRRTFVRRAAAGGVTATLAGGMMSRGWSAKGAASVVPLPSPDQVLADVQTMVDFGPRLPGTTAHADFRGWLEEQLVTAGLQLQACDQFDFHKWEAEQIGLEILHGPAPGQVEVATSIVRSRDTGTQGVEGPLIYGGTLPPPSLTGEDLASDIAAIKGYSQVVASWASALTGSIGGSVNGSILLVDLPAPVPATAAVFTAITSYWYWPGHTAADWAQVDYKRPWIGPWPDLSPFANQGAKAVVFIVDGSFAELQGNFSPHTGGFQPIPGLVVDRDTGTELRQQAATRPHTRATLVAPVEQTTVSSITAVLPGERQLRGENYETIIVDTHTDGQNAIEENGTACCVELARHFASLPPGQRLKRTLVIALWASHMTAELPASAAEWIPAHMDLVNRAAAAITIEHLGCPQWIDTLDQGYHSTGQNEPYGIWTAPGGPLFDLSKAALIEAQLDRHSLLMPPIEITTGAPFHDNAGVPHIGGIAGPTYLLNVTDTNELDKFDPELASRQTAFYADLIQRIEGVSAADLRMGDPTLGYAGPLKDTPHSEVACGPGTSTT